MCFQGAWSRRHDSRLRPADCSAAFPRQKGQYSGPTAVMDVGLPVLPLTGDFSAHAGLTVLVTESFGKSIKSQSPAWQAPRKMWLLPVELKLTTLYGASSTSGLIAWKVEHGKFSSAEGVEIFHGKPPSVWRKRFIRRQPLSEACTLGKQECQGFKRLCALSSEGGFGVQDVAMKQRILNFLCLFHIFLEMSDLVAFRMSPSLVAVRFGFGEQLFHGGSSTHLGEGKAV